ncbi:LOW QUALITY PROTEIN: hypothetical protein AAY473_021280 [Plecturocebus cupreus]
MACKYEQNPWKNPSVPAALSASLSFLLGQFPRLRRESSDHLARRTQSSVPSLIDQHLLCTSASPCSPCGYLRNMTAEEEQKIGLCPQPRWEVREDKVNGGSTSTPPSRSSLIMVPCDCRRPSGLQTFLDALALLITSSPQPMARHQGRRPGDSEARSQCGLSLVPNKSDMPHRLASSLQIRSQVGLQTAHHLDRFQFPQLPNSRIRCSLPFQTRGFYEKLDQGLSTGGPSRPRKQHSCKGEMSGGAHKKRWDGGPTASCAGSSPWEATGRPTATMESGFFCFSPAGPSWCPWESGHLTPLYKARGLRPLSLTYLPRRCCLCRSHKREEKEHCLLVTDLKIKDQTSFRHGPDDRGTLTATTYCAPSTHFSLICTITLPWGRTITPFYG